MSFSSSHQFAVDSNGCTPVQPQPNHTWKTTLFGKTFFLIHDRGIRYRYPDLLLCHFFIEDSAIRFLSCPFALELYYSLHSFCILWRVFFFFCLHFHTLPLFVFVFHYVVCSFGKTNKQKTPRKAVLFHEYQASTGRSNKFVSLLAASVFFYDHCVKACVCVCVRVFLLQATHKKMCILVLLKMFRRTIPLVQRVCVYQLRPSIKEGQQLQVHLET